MKVHQIQEKNYQHKKQPHFKGIIDNSLRYLVTNQALGANGVDLAFMVIPRTTTDMIGRGPAAGAETLRREASGTANHSLIGAYGIASGLVAAKLLGIDKNKVAVMGSSAGGHLAALVSTYNQLVYTSEDEIYKENTGYGFSG